MIDVVIPVYNRVKYLRETVQSVFAQTYTDWNLFVVDDGSDEDVPAALGSFLKDPRVRYIRQPNQGNGMARNAGACSGNQPFVTMLDSDDVWAPDFVQACLERLTNEPQASVVYTAFKYIDEEGRDFPYQPAAEQKSGLLLKDLLMGMPILPSSAVIRRSAFIKWGFYTPGLDDWELWLRFAANGCYFVGIKEIKLSYRLHDQNFNLAWEKRKVIHFTMLDHFFQTPGLSQDIINLRPKAYGWQHFLFALSAWKSERKDQAIQEFISSVELYPQLLEKVETYYRIACSHQPRGYEGSREGFLLEKADATLLSSLESIFRMQAQNGSMTVSRSRSFSMAYYVLGMLAYSLARNYHMAVRYLWKSIWSDPGIMCRERWVGVMVRSHIRSVS